MGISQLIYTSTCVSAMTRQMSYEVSCKSVQICEHLGLTGRVFANNQQAFAITEGPDAIVRQYFEAVSRDSLVASILLHMDNSVKAREFSDYSVLLNLGGDFVFGDKVRKLTPESYAAALPDRPSVKLRMMLDVYLTDEILMPDQGS